MARVNAPLLAFNRGEISKIGLARVDLAKLQLAAECELNWEPFVVGPMMLRRGLGFVGEVRADNASCLIDFVYAKFDTALYELTANVLRVWLADQTQATEALLSRASVATAVSDPTFNGGGTWVTSDTTAGCTTTISSGALTLAATAVGGLARAKQAISVAGGDYGKEHGLRLVVTNGPVTVRAGSSDGLSDLIAQTVLDTGTHSLSVVPSSNINLQIESTDAWAKTLSSVSIEAGGTVTISTPWGASALATLRWTQSGDIVYVAQYGGQQYKIERRGTRPGARGFSVVAYRSSNGPFLPVTPIEANLTPSAYYGNGTLTSDRAYFQSSHVGALFQLFSSGQANQTVVGAANAFSPAVRVNGVGTAARDYTWTVTGTWSGTITLQRSFDGPDSGFHDVSTTTSNGTIASNSGTGDTPDLDNIIAWERVGFKGGQYTSGAATVVSNYGGGGGFGICRVTAWVSSTVVDIEILSPFTSLTATNNWQESAWSPYQGWPTSPAFFEGRLWWFSGGTIPVAGSQSNNYTGYAEQDIFGNDLGEAGAILEAFGEGPSDSVNWGLALTRLLAGREGSIASMRSSAFDEVITSTNFSVKDCATEGTARLAALKIDKRGVFVQESGRRVYALEWDTAALDYSCADLTRLNLDIGLPGIACVAAARQPDTALYFVRNDGQCAVLLYDPADDVMAWYRIQTLGTIEQVRVLPANSGAEQRVFFVVKRTVNGATKRFIEKLSSRDNCVGGLINQQLDCAVTYQGVASGTIALPQLPSTTVSVWADGLSIGTAATDGSGNAAMPDGKTHANYVAGLAGATVTAQAAAGATITSITGLSAYNGLTAEVFADQQPSGRMIRVGALTVAAGAIALPANWQASSIVAFLGYQAPFMSAKLAYAAQGGSALTQPKKINRVGLVMYDVHQAGIQQGQRFDQLDPLPALEDSGAVAAGTIWSEYDQREIAVPGEWDTDARLCLLAQAPLPAKVAAAIVTVATDEG
jgi:hypothetical protein